MSLQLPISSLLFSTSSQLHVVSAPTIYRFTIPLNSQRLHHPLSHRFISRSSRTTPSRLKTRTHKDARKNTEIAKSLIHTSARTSLQPFDPGGSHNTQKTDFGGHSKEGESRRQNGRQQWVCWLQSKISTNITISSWKKCQGCGEQGLEIITRAFAGLFTKRWDGPWVGRAVCKLRGEGQKPGFWC
jgi:hypothetical protein